MSKIDRIKELVQLLNKARKAYYVESNEIMSNKQYDKQYEELENLEKETGVIYNNSPTQNIGYEVKDTLVKIKHPEPMLSLGKTKDPNEMLKFLGDKEGILSWKLDGLTLVLEYEDGKLKSAVTRGNGEVGTDVLHIAKTIINLPQNIAYKGKLIIRGECVVSYPDFAEINIDNKYQNPRNLASGTLMLLDANIARNRNLKWIAFNLVQANIDFNNSFEEQFKWLKSLGFDTVGYKKVNKDNLLETIKWFDDEIKNYDIPSDGLVLVFNDLKYRDKLGSTIHEPLGWKAFKWKDNTVETILKDIQFNMGRTGVLTPVAVFNPIELESTTVTRASIHNLNILKSLQLGIGDKIEVYKANKIIPQIYDNLTRSDTFIIPNQCPYCGSNTTAIKTDGGEFLYCFNKDCVSKKIQQFAHFVSRNAMNIIGLSDKSIEKFIDLGFLKDLPDIYKLEQYKNQIINLEGFGEKSYNKLIKSINNSKNCILANFIFALGIPNVGLSTAKNLCDYFDNDINLLMNANMKDFLNIKDIGEIVTASIYSWFNNDKNIEMLQEIFTYIEFNEKENNFTNIKNNILLGKTIYPTGKFQLKKNDLKIKLEQLGAIVSNGYKKSLGYLICGGDTSKSGKVQKAIKDNVKLMTEDQLIQIFKENNII